MGDTDSRTDDAIRDDFAAARAHPMHRTGWQDVEGSNTPNLIYQSSPSTADAIARLVCDVPALLARATAAEQAVNEATKLRAENDKLRRNLGSVCPTPCDNDCETLCHEDHVVSWKKYHAANHHADLAQLRNERETERARAVAAEERIEAVRALHTHGPLGSGREVCDVCTNDEGTWQSWPCPTVAALGPSTAPRPRWDHATLDELVRRRNAFTGSWGECISEMKAETTAPGADG